MGEMIVEITKHNGEKRIALYQNNTSGTPADLRIRQLPGRMFSATRKMWHIPYRDDFHFYLTQWFSGVEDVKLVFNTKVKSPAFVNTKEVFKRADTSPVNCMPQPCL